MTATARRTRAPAATMSLLPLAEVALTCVALAAVVGLRRVFPGTDWLGHLGLQVVAAHAVAAGLRRRGVGFAVSAAVTLAVGALAIAWLYAGETTTFGLPTGTTLDVLRTAVDDSATAFSEVKAPAPEPVLTGFFVLTAVAIWVGAVLADWAAFRVDAPVEAVLPSATLFVLGAVFGAEIDRMLLAGLWIAAVLAFVLLRRADRLGRTATWVGERRAGGPRTIVVLGGLLALGAVVVAAVVGPRLPGASAEAVISPTDVFDEGPGTRVTVSPLVDIRSRLVDQADVEVFTVRSPVRDYWRLTSLDRFDGQIWSSNGSYSSGDGDLDDGVPVDAERIEFEQTYSIGALSQIWLPAAYEPQAVDSATPVRYDDVSGTLIVDTDIDTSDDTTYRVTSALPVHQPEALATASTEIPDEIAETYLDLPDDFSDAVRDIAQAVTADATSAYDASLRLQNFFRDNFVYDLQIGAGHSEDAMEQFVTEIRRGYCEQFAGSFAAMARSLGIPARVAVGFTPGSADAVDPTLYRVRGENAHAWPEVFLGEFGWVRFEPTPGRGAPFAEQYTGVAEQQVATGGDGTTATTTVSPPSTAPADPTELSTPDLPTDQLDEIDQGTGGLAEDPASAWPGRLAWGALAVVGAVALYLAAVAAVTSLRRWRRHRHAVETADKIALAWDDSMRSVRRAGVPVRRAETAAESARRIGRRLPSIDAPLGTLARTVQDATYAPAEPEPAAGALAQELATEIESAAAATMSAVERFRTRFHPTQLSERK